METQNKDSLPKWAVRISSLQGFVRLGLRLLRMMVSNLMYMLSFLLITVYLLSAWAGYIPPAYSAIPAILGLFFPFLLLLTLLCTGCWLLRRRWGMLSILVLTYVATWDSISLYCPLNGAEEVILQEEDVSLRVLSYNTCTYGWKGHSDKKPNPVLQYIRSIEPDIVCLQESGLASDTPWGITERQLRSYFSDRYPYIHTYIAQGSGTTLILLSRYPVLQEEPLPIKSRANGGIRYRLQVGRRQVDVYNLHLESFRLRQSDGEEYLSLVKQGEALKLGDILETKLGPAFHARNVQANLVHEHIKRSLKEVEVLVCGDFNDTPISYTRRKIASGLTDAYQSVGSGLGFTYTTGIFQVRIDHMLSSSGLKPVKSVVDRTTIASDHYPLFTTFVLR